jgi:hypothetical protein
MWMKIVTGCVVATTLTACLTPPPIETPVLDALDQPVYRLGRGVALRDWDATTSATRDIVAIMDAR